MTDVEYSLLQNFATLYLNNNYDSEAIKTYFYQVLNGLPRTHNVYCLQCIHHMDCDIEKILPGNNYEKFCSYGKEK